MAGTALCQGAGDTCVWWVSAILERLNQSFEIRLTELQDARAQVFCSHPMCFLKSDSKLHLNLCLCFSLSQIPSIHIPCWLLQNSEKCQFSSFSIKHIYISWLGVLSEKYFIFFLIALFAFDFLNFHGLHGCACRGLFVYTRVGWGFFRCMCWSHGHMIPTSCGSDWPGLVFCSCFCSFEE